MPSLFKFRLLLCQYVIDLLNSVVWILSPCFLESQNSWPSPLEVLHCHCVELCLFSSVMFPKSCLQFRESPDEVMCVWTLTPPWLLLQFHLEFLADRQIRRPSLACLIPGLTPVRHRTAYNTSIYPKHIEYQFHSYCILFFTNKRYIWDHLYIFINSHL